MSDRLARWCSQVCVLGAVCSVLAVDAFAQVPRLVRYQGQAQDANGVPLEGPYNLTCRLYDAETAGSLIWQETQSSVPLTKGHFSILLGQISPLSVDWSKSLWLSVQVGSEVELSPRQRITSVPMAIRAEEAERLSGAGRSTRVRHSTAISVPTDSWVDLPFDTEASWDTWDTDNIHSPTSNPGRLTARTAGTYLIYTTVCFAPNPKGSRLLYLTLGGGAVIAAAQVPAVIESHTCVALSHAFSLAAGDYVTVAAIQRSGETIDVVASSTVTPVFGMVKVQ